VERPSLLVRTAVLAGLCGTTLLAQERRDWSIDRAPLVKVAATAADGSVRFSSAASVTRTRDGLIVVADRLGARVTFLAPDGAIRRVVGREGSGPGEFRAPMAVLPCSADSLFVFDYLLRRVTVLDGHGAVTRQESLRDFPSVIACDKSGVMAMMGMPSNLQPPNDRGESPPLSAPLVVRGTHGDTLWRELLPDVGEPRPLGRLTRLAIGGGAVYVGTQLRAGVARIDLRSKRRTMLQVGRLDRTPTSAHVERAIDALVAPLPVASDREQSRRMLRQIPMPKTLVPFTALLVDPVGLLWSVVSVPGDGETRLDVHDPTGRVRARLRMDGDVVVHEVGPDYVLGVRKTDDDEDEVVVYRLRRGR
jgi:hypothetical protein